MSVTVKKTFSCDKCKKIVSSKKEKLPGDNWLEFETKFFSGNNKDDLTHGHVCGIQCFADLVSDNKDALCLSWGRVEKLHLPA